MSEEAVTPQESPVTVETVTPPVEGDVKQDTAPVTPAAPATADAPTTQPQPTLQELIDRADAKELRRHPKIAGILGSDRQSAIEADRLSRAKSATEIAKTAQEEELLKMFEDNAAYMKEHYPKAHEHLVSLQQGRMVRQLDDIQSKTRDELALSIGQGITDIPEWRDISEEEKLTLGESLKGLDANQILPVFQRQVIDMLATRRANNLLAKWKGTELAKEREVIRNEEAAKLLKKTQAPDTTPAKGPAGSNLGRLAPSEFDKLSPPGESVADAIRRIHGGNN